MFSPKPISTKISTLNGAKILRECFWEIAGGTEVFAPVAHVNKTERLLELRGVVFFFFFFLKLVTVAHEIFLAQSHKKV